MLDTLMAGRYGDATQPRRTAGRLEVRWIPVTDARGRTHMEACWVTVGDQRSVAAA